MPKHTKQRKSRIEINHELPELPWRSRLPRGKFIEHPTTIDDFRQWPQLDESSYTYLSYLSMCDKQLKGTWIDAWESVFAVGPFLGRRRVYSSIPFVIVANYRRPYRHLLRLSEILADVYLEFGILPDLHILPIKVVTQLDEFQNIQWTKTKMVSIRWAEGI